jgi:hypothetical protein
VSLRDAHALAGSGQSRQSRIYMAHGHAMRFIKSVSNGCNVAEESQRKRRVIKEKRSVHNGTKLADKSQSQATKERVLEWTTKLYLWLKLVWLHATCFATTRRLGRSYKYVDVDTIKKPKPDASWNNGRSIRPTFDLNAITSSIPAHQLENESRQRACCSISTICTELALDVFALYSSRD